MILQVHHLGYWQQDRSDRPANLITLCTNCHTLENHQPQGFLYGWKPRLKSFKPETFMSTVRWRLTEQSEAAHTYGYMTKSKRIALGLPKSHHNDAKVDAPIHPIDLRTNGFSGRDFIKTMPTGFSWNPLLLSE